MGSSQMGTTVALSPSLKNTWLHDFCPNTPRPSAGPSWLALRLITATDCLINGVACLPVLYLQQNAVRLLDPFLRIDQARAARG
ncbi:hypothetical protein BaRGS_00025990, partial [Batillaria attramentaria]